MPLTNGVLTLGLANPCVCVCSLKVYVMGQSSKATLPRDEGGPMGQRIGVSVGGDLSWGLRVMAYVTGRVSSSDWLRYSLIVLNWQVFCHFES